MSKTAIITIAAMIYLGTSMLVSAGIDVWKIYENREAISKVDAATARLEALSH